MYHQKTLIRLSFMCQKPKMSKEKLDYTLITLKTLSPFISVSKLNKEDIMLNNIGKTDLFYDYYTQWITVYKEGAIRKVTMDKYLLTQSWIKRLAPNLPACR